MNTKHNFYFCFYIIIALMLLSRLPAATAITNDELADICEQMESAIVDISLEYEWHADSSLTTEQRLEYITGKGLLIVVGIPRYRFSAARSSSGWEPNDPNRSLFDRLLLEESSTLMNEHRNTWDSSTKISFDGKLGKSLHTGGWPRGEPEGIISSERPNISAVGPTPVEYFSIHSSKKITKNVPLSIMLRQKEFARVDNAVQKINSFNTICAELLSTLKKQVYFRIYFAIDHSYTPVRYEFVSGGKLIGAFDVQSLQKVGDGLWFPSSGVISSPDSEEISVYQTIGEIVVNQGLSAEDFDIEFPVGTKVHDEIQGRDYVVKAAEQ
jgi:hypothetical protein